MEYLKPDIAQMNANATHAGILAAMLAKTTGSMLELGVGHFSTPTLYYVAKITGRYALSVETSREWYDFFADQFSSDSHKFFCTDNRLISTCFEEYYGEKHWDVVLVDNGPSTDRVSCIEMLRKKAKYIIVHDSESAAVAYDWSNIFETFKYKYYWDFYGNGTTVVSDEMEIGL